MTVEDIKEIYRHYDTYFGNEVGTFNEYLDFITETDHNTSTTMSEGLRKILSKIEKL